MTDKPRFTEGADASRKRSLLILAFGAVYVIWGSTYLGIRVAVETLPPFLMAGGRFFVAGGLLLLVLRMRGAAWPTPRQWRTAAIVGTALLVGGNGLVCWAEQTVPSGLAALTIATTPAWFALLEWLRPGGQRPDRLTVTGILVGFAGVAVLATSRDAAAANRNDYWGVLALVLACSFWAAGSLYAKHAGKTDSPWMGAAAQMLCGSGGLLVIACLRGEPARVALAEVSGRSWLALLYLVVFGSWIAFSAYLYLLRESTPARVSTYAYVNPLIAVLLGWLILDERLSPRMAWAAVLIVAGVVVITWPRRRAP
jgi:drug/metabolite transporter (DMT)-like permease